MLLLYSTVLELCQIVMKKFKEVLQQVQKIKMFTAKNIHAVIILIEKHLRDVIKFRNFAIFISLPLHGDYSIKYYDLL